MSKRKSDTSSKASQKAGQTNPPSKSPRFPEGSRYLASEEEQREFARKYPGEYVISFAPPIVPKPKKKGD